MRGRFEAEKARMIKSGIKTKMIIMFFDRKRVVHREFVRQRRTVNEETKEKYLNGYATRLDASGKKFATIGCCPTTTRQTPLHSLYPICWTKWVCVSCPSRRTAPICFQWTSFCFQGLKQLSKELAMAQCR